MIIDSQCDLQLTCYRNLILDKVLKNKMSINANDVEVESSLKSTAIEIQLALCVYPPEGERRGLLRKIERWRRGKESDSCDRNTPRVNLSLF